MKLTQLDTNQIIRVSFDEETRAQRVMVVAGAMPDVKVDIDASSITKAIQTGLESFKPIITVSEPSKSEKTQRIEVPVIIKETVIERIEIPVIVKEIEYREIRIPVEVPKIVEIEKPVVIKEQQIQVVRQSTLETKYLRIAVGCLIVLELITLLISRH